jgi:biotin carboxylase
MRVVRTEAELRTRSQTARDARRCRVRQRRRLHREVPREPAPHRDSRSRRRARPRIHLGERDCSMQRRHQKLIEEAPSPVLTPELREKMGDGAVEAPQARRLRRRGHDRVPARRGRPFYFMEMNTRIQVEHPGDRDDHARRHRAQQIRVAQGELGIAVGRGLQRPRDRVPHQRRGPAHVRAVARTSSQAFNAPGGPGVRVDTHATPATRAALLRLDDRQAHRARAHARGGDRAHAPRARSDGHRGDQDDDSAPPRDHGIVFKKKRRKQYKRTQGHRQDYTTVKIESIG